MKKAFYLDNNNNIVSREKSTHVVLQEYDEDGNLIKEKFGFVDNMKPEVEDIDFGEPSPEIKSIVDDFVEKSSQIKR